MDFGEERERANQAYIFHEFFMTVQMGTVLICTASQLGNQSFGLVKNNQESLLGNKSTTDIS